MKKEKKREKERKKLAVDEAENVVVHVVRARASTYELEHLEEVEGVPVVDLPSAKREQHHGGPKTKCRIPSDRIISDRIRYRIEGEGGKGEIK